MKSGKQRRIEIMAKRRERFKLIENANVFRARAALIS